MASVSRALPRRSHAAIATAAVRTAAHLGGGLGIVCSMPSYGQRKEKEERGLTIASAPTTTVTPVLRHCQIVCKAEANISSNLPESIPSGANQYEKIVELLTTLFPVWVILGTIIGIYKPSMVTWLETDLFTVGLGFLMLSMGLTLTFEDFRRCMRNPWTVGVGFLAQYLIKPMLGFAIAMYLILKTMKLSAPLATGLILVSCCPGGQASNVATYISKGSSNMRSKVSRWTITD
ncbi:hypothetical protein GUJ93_ZPchr0007g3502 [Zizania palustris]|uniref:Uncharacterized protein n=1 Tax=Zizania palustris TaxID=103762 RepID=A0A8J5TDX7_ZIZPA|nr:hypothetical protein GUJ93_ZPchr0007g3502 [Zizania palustris]